MLQLPVISPVNSPSNRSLSPSHRSLFTQEKPSPREEDRFANHDSEPTHPKYLTGYTGHIPVHLVEKEPVHRDIVPTVGYTGHYRGKRNGKLGRVELHRSNVSTWEKETVSDIIGIRTIQDDWEYVHEAASCSNFSESFPSNFASPATTNSAVTIASSTSSKAGSEVKGFLKSKSGEGTTLHVPITKELVNALNWVLVALEARFKTSDEARKALKSAFFIADPFKTGTVKDHEFIDILHMFGVPLLTSDPNWMILSEVLRIEPHSDEFSYGRFLNIIVPSKAARKSKIDFSDYD